ncbi:hypothetical protein BC834DRAFT_835840 [Gloeopeniophorella convolvens]|nr:hypothetical protein BC834DRAFT_835840 [Gloeopeniophorella convolvens]
MFSPSVTHEHGIVLLYRVISIVCQSLCYGVYATLFPNSTYLMVQKGVGTKVKKFLLGMTVAMFTLSTLYFALCMVWLIQLISNWLIPIDPTTSATTICLPLFSALVLVNYVLTDGVVVWRAWVLCNDDNRKLLVASIFFLGCTSLMVGATIAIRIALTVVSPSDPRQQPLTQAINVGQVGGLVLSLVTNILATSAVALKAWRRRKEIAGIDIVERTSRAGKALALLVESGALYIVSLATGLVCVLIRVPDGTLGDLYAPVNTQIAGIYPIIILLPVNQGHSLDKTVFPSKRIRMPMIMGTGSCVPCLDTIRFNSGTSTPGSEDQDSKDSLNRGSFKHMLESDFGSIAPSPRRYRARGCDVEA